MSSQHKDQSHSHQETAPTECLQQNYGFKPAYDHQRVPPPYPTNEEYQRQPPSAPSAPYPVMPPPHHPHGNQHHPPSHHHQPPPHHHQPPPHIHVQPMSVHVEHRPGPPPRFVYLQPRHDSPWCIKLCCECMCAIVSSVLYTVLGILLLIVAIGVIVYFARFYNH